VTDIDDILDDARDAAGDFLNANERDIGHVILGVAVTVRLARRPHLPARTAHPPRPPNGRAGR